MVNTTAHPIVFEHRSADLSQASMLPFLRHLSGGTEAELSPELLT